MKLKIFIMDMDFLCCDYYNLFDSLEEWNELDNKYETNNNKNNSELIKFGEILYNHNSTSFVYICELCHKILHNIKHFSEHIRNVHDFYTKFETDTIEDALPIDKNETHDLEINDFVRSESNISEKSKSGKNCVALSGITIHEKAVKSGNKEKNTNIHFQENMDLTSSNFNNNCDDEYVKRPRSPSIMRINKESRPIDFISNPWHCECGRIVPITHKYQHMKSHNDVPIYECQITGCFDIFFRQSELDEHYDLIHNSQDPAKPFSCQFCQRHFSNKKNYSTHVKRIHLSDPRHHTCPHCHYYFYSKSYLQQHINKKHNDVLSKNEIQSGVLEGTNEHYEYENNFPSEEFYADYENEHCEFQCKFCNTTLSSNKDLLCHMEKLHNVKQISLCRICGYDISSELHKGNCLRTINPTELPDINENSEMSVISLDAEHVSTLENNSNNEYPDDEMDFLKFLNVDFDK